MRVNPPGSIVRGVLFGMLHVGVASALVLVAGVLAAIFPGTEWAANVGFGLVVLATAEGGVMVRRIFWPGASAQMPDWLREEGF